MLHGISFASVSTFTVNLQELETSGLSGQPVELPVEVCGERSTGRRSVS